MSPGLRATFAGGSPVIQNPANGEDRTMRMLLTLPLAALAFAGCGSESNTNTAGGGASAPPAASTPAASEPASKPASGPQEVRIADFKFVPATLEVPVGTRITWTNEDDAPHNAIGPGLKTKDLRKGQSDTVTLTKPGTYSYVCTFHPFMKGTVIVR